MTEAVWICRRGVKLMLICLQVMFLSALPAPAPFNPSSPRCTLTPVLSKMAFLANRPGVCFNTDESGGVLGGVITTDETSQWTWREAGGVGRKGNGWNMSLAAAVGSRLPQSSSVSSDVGQMASRHRPHHLCGDGKRSRRLSSCSALGFRASAGTNLTQQAKVGQSRGVSAWFKHPLPYGESLYKHVTPIKIIREKQYGLKCTERRSSTPPWLRRDVLFLCLMCRVSEGDFPFVRVNPRLLSRTKLFLPLKAVRRNEAGRLSTRGDGL